MSAQLIFYGHSTTGTSCYARTQNKMWITLRVNTQLISACTRSHSPM